MALTIAVCVAGFSFIYAALDDTVGDFISRDAPDPVTPTAVPTESSLAQNPAEDPPDSDTASEAESEPTEEPTVSQLPKQRNLPVNLCPTIRHQARPHSIFAMSHLLRVDKTP